MNVIDLTIAIIVLWGLYRGFQSGMIKTAMSFVGWFVALIIASSLAKTFSVFFVGVVDDRVLQISLAFLAIVLAVVCLTQLVSWIALKTLKLLKLGFLDKILGGALGATKGILVVLIMMSLSSPLLSRLPSWQDAILAQSLLPFAPVARTLLVEMASTTWDSIDNPYQ